MMNKNFIREKLYAGNPVIGIWSIINSPITVDIAAHTGLDFQILDMEHGVSDMTTLDNCIRSCESMQCSPLVRVPGLQPSIIQSCLDLGAHGVIVPQVKDLKETLAVINAAKFSPVGSRGFNPFTRANNYNPMLPLSTTKLNNSFALTGIILENKNIFAQLDQILAIPDLDILYLGIYDLSFDLGLAGNVNHPSIQEFVMSALKKIKNAGKFSALMVKNEIETKKYVEVGANLIVYGVDTNIYYSAIMNNVTAFKNRFSTTIQISSTRE